jgi:ornithine cyclodeaminase/alanine dehydrogenase-like protein (mu-crystallin family)
VVVIVALNDHRMAASQHEPQAADTAPVYLTEHDVVRLLDRAAVLANVEDTLRRVAGGDVVDGPKTGMETGSAEHACFSGVVLGYLRDRHIVGVKIFATASDNPGRGLPRVPATILISDSRTGMVQGIVQATAITARRTAALAIASVRPWIRGKISKAAIIGFGAIGREIAAYLDEHFYGADVAVFGRNEARTRETCKQIMGTGRIRLQANAAAKDAVVGAQLVFVATGLTEDKPIVKGAWIDEGAVVCALGSHQEVDDELIVGAGCILVDHWQAIQKRGNLAAMIASGRLTRASVQDVVDAVSGKIKNEKFERHLLIALIGMGSLDVALATAALEAARKKGMGLSLR